MKTYEEFINNILITRGRFACGEEYHEQHHIIPKCMNGTNDNNNLIDLYAKEHYEAHKLLALENPECSGLQIAWFLMCHIHNKDGIDYEITSEEYEEARIAFSKSISGENNPMYGRTWWDDNTPQEKIDEWKSAIAESNSKENHYLYGKHIPEETRKKISKANKGKTMSEGARKKISENNKGRIVSENTRQAVAKANANRIWSEKSKEKLSQSISGDKNPMYNRPWWDENTPQEKRDEWIKHLSDAQPKIPVIQLTKENEFVAEYPSVKNASMTTGIPEPNIIQVYNHTPHRKTAGGYKWMTKEEYLTTQNN